MVAVRFPSQKANNTESVSIPYRHHAFWRNDIDPLSQENALNRYIHYIDGLVQDCSISIANAMEILQSSTKPSICQVTHTTSVESAKECTSLNQQLVCHKECFYWVGGRPNPVVAKIIALDSFLNSKSMAQICTLASFWRRIGFSNRNVRPTLPIL